MLCEHSKLNGPFIGKDEWSDKKRTSMNKSALRALIHAHPDRARGELIQREMAQDFTGVPKLLPMIVVNTG